MIIPIQEDILTRRKALVEAKLNDRYSTIREATFGIAFFGTPHQGGNQATLGDIAAKIARAVLSSPGNTFMEHLKKDSLFSENLTNDFKHQYEDYHILSFYETMFFKSTMGLVCITVDLKALCLLFIDCRQKFRHTWPIRQA